MTKITTYFREALYELRKVTWPTKKQTINYSIVVIALTITMAVFFALLDYIFTRLLGLII
ncbi:MAG: preprotein translocase subunit SecE [Candidatus Magasanikbacteria bacterium CG11_big_fil_rev_8_21_14_0_20_43_7]|uniref:Protein translocase subunit SecE n=1 Tax=Candidatus Magasanikbacteria bacterium CG11_big_fil_rev_8_21_14_0_20_43_7 TaxID=1974654 RepID=A0A2H0N2W6_9BACT|nr:MAG: preprotein translocase subunit SecE [Candidatus Magasanikbacteria bacterium CG11_big_fil_rev_8_21_14_0_20_43_7]